MAFLPGIENIRTPLVSVSHIREQHKSSNEDGSIKTRPKFTKARKKFTLTWKGKRALSSTELSALITCFDTYMGTSFSFTNPDDDTAYTVIFSDDGIRYDSPITGSGIYEVSLTLEEP